MPSLDNYKITWSDIGKIIFGLSLIITAVVQFTDLKERVTVLEKSLNSHEAKDVRFAEKYEVTMTTSIESNQKLNDILRRLDRIENKLESK